jgi:alcohol-forming fatty acyl-CoA reductase
MRFTSHTLNPIANGKTIFDDADHNESEFSRNLPSIPQFYAGQEIFITGGSGFMGKVLIEKLLRSCPDIKAIYILLRPKKGKSIKERLKVITDLPLFEPISNHSPKLLQKLVAVEGDVTELELGLSKSDITRMKNVSIIFHSAASVRFDDSLQYAVFMNTRGTREIMQFAKGLRNIKVIMHVSTTYSHPELKFVGEKIHEPYVSWQKTIKICEKMDEEVLNMMTPKYTTYMPNTYTFTKALAEQVVDDHKNELPLLIFRPSIVISSMKEPFPG